MREKIITIYPKPKSPDGIAGGLMIYESVAESLGLRNGQTVSEAQFWQALAENATYGIAQCQMRLAIEKINASGSDSAILGEN